VERIGPYRLIESIGQGSTSHVYKGYDEALNRFVAVKTIIGPAQDDETQRKRFEREAQAAASLTHPRIVTVYDFGHQEGRLYMAMELLEGCDLKQGLTEGQLARLEDKLDVMDQICDGLAFAHAQGVVHRDLKPANIRLLPNRQIKILDFGLARVSGSDMTRTGLVVGTPHYMSPEQVRGEHVDVRSDVFGLGCLFYEMLTGARPFDAESLHAVFYKVLQSEPMPASKRVSSLPRVLDQVLIKALAKAREDRFKDAGEFGRVLSQVREAIAAGEGDGPLLGLTRPPKQARAGGTPTPAAGAPRPTGAGRPVRTLWIVAATALVLVPAAWFAARRFGEPTPSSPSPSPRDRPREALATDIANTRASLARRRFDSGDYAGASRDALEALKFDPTNASARETLAQVRDTLASIEKAVMETRAGLAGREGARAAEGFWDLLKVAPQHGAAMELAPELEGGFKDRAEEARRIMAEARGEAERQGAALREAFQEGLSSADAAEAAFKGRAFASAAREFMKARASFERARRTAR
jgi:serine/threonine-protein kinase